MPSDGVPHIFIQQKQHKNLASLMKKDNGKIVFLGKTIFMDNIVLRDGKIEKGIPLTDLFTKAPGSPEFNCPVYPPASEYLKDSPQLRIADESITKNEELSVLFGYDPKRCKIDENDNCIGVQEYGAKSLQCKEDLVSFYITCHYPINPPHQADRK